MKPFDSLFDNQYVYEQGTPKGLQKENFHTYFILAIRKLQTELPYQGCKLYYLFPLWGTNCAS